MRFDFGLVEAGLTEFPIHRKYSNCEEQEAQAAPWFAGGKC